jgi:hypothetical protein
MLEEWNGGILENRNDNISREDARSQKKVPEVRFNPKRRAGWNPKDHFE